ncbi:MAG: hypothetical protein HY926_07105 [Elusimicrobia bacterium]|nr:hypothetical protein [Elusimicrobiota bacterium]
MKRCGDGIALADTPEKCVGGTVLVWVLDPLDVGVAQEVAKALCRSIGLDSDACLMISAEVSEKGSGLLGSDAGGLLVLCPRGARVSIEAVDFLGPPAPTRI